MRRLVRALAWAGLALFATGCLQGQTSVLPAHGSVRTQEELYARYGPPETMHRDGELRLLRYDRARLRGMAVGVGWMGTRWAMVNQHQVGDHVWFWIDESGRIVGTKRGVYDQSFHYTPWPFGD